MLQISDKECFQVILDLFIVGEVLCEVLKLLDKPTVLVCLFSPLIVSWCVHQNIYSIMIYYILILKYKLTHLDKRFDLNHSRPPCDSTVADFDVLISIEWLRASLSWVGGWVGGGLLTSATLQFIMQTIKLGARHAKKTRRFSWKVDIVDMQVSSQQ